MDSATNSKPYNLFVFLATFLACESRYWIPKTANKFIKISREVVVFLLCETIMCTAAIVVLEDCCNFHRIMEIISKEPLLVVIFCAIFRLPGRIGSYYEYIKSFDVHLSLDSTRSKWNQILFTTTNCIYFNVQNTKDKTLVKWKHFELYLQTSEGNKKKYSRTIRLIYSIIGSIMLYALMFLLLSPQMHIAAIFILAAQFWIVVLSKDIFKLFVFSTHSTLIYCAFFVYWTYRFQKYGSIKNGRKISFPKKTYHVEMALFGEILDDSLATFCHNCYCRMSKLS